MIGFEFRTYAFSNEENAVFFREFNSEALRDLARDVDPKVFQLKRDAAKGADALTQPAAYAKNNAKFEPPARRSLRNSDRSPMRRRSALDSRPSVPSVHSVLSQAVGDVLHEAAPSSVPEQEQDNRAKLASKIIEDLCVKAPGYQQWILTETGQELYLGWKTLDVVSCTRPMRERDEELWWGFERLEMCRKDKTTLEIIGTDGVMSGWDKAAGENPEDCFQFTCPSCTLVDLTPGNEPPSMPKGYKHSQNVAEVPPPSELFVRFLFPDGGHWAFPRGLGSARSFVTGLNAVLAAGIFADPVTASCASVRTHDRQTDRSIEDEAAFAELFMRDYRWRQFEIEQGMCDTEQADRSCSRPPGTCGCMPNAEGPAAGVPVPLSAQEMKRLHALETRIPFPRQAALLGFWDTPAKKLSSKSSCLRLQRALCHCIAARYPASIVTTAARSR
jgi:hypothetical protein